MEKQFLGIHTSFSDLNLKNYTEIKFNTPVSILDYDAVIISTSWLVATYSAPETFQGLPLFSRAASVRILSDFKRIKNELITFLESGRNVFVLLGRNEDHYIYTGETQYSGSGKNATQKNVVDKFDPLSFLPVKVQLEYASGDRISADCGYPFKDFFSVQKDNIYYSAYFATAVGTPIARIAKTDRIVASVVEYGKGNIVFLPDAVDESNFKTSTAWKKEGAKYLNSLFELDHKLNSPDEYTLPEWTKTIYVPGEKAIAEKAEKARSKIEAIKKALEKSLSELEETQKLKVLLSGTGTLLENTVKDILSRIGFSVSPAQPGRADICAYYNEQPIVCEVKGLTKSAGEKNAAQLEKWAALFYEEHDCSSKPILIVNAFKDLPLMERNEDAFPPQMLPYATSRGHCLMTTTQLLCMYIDILSDPSKADSIISNLLNTVGVFDKYQDATSYLDIVAS